MKDLVVLVADKNTEYAIRGVLSRTDSLGLVAPIAFDVFVHPQKDPGVRRQLEVWVWSDSPHVRRILGWEGRDPSLREWLVESGFLEKDRTKPARPKEALERALRIVKKPRSSNLYLLLATSVSLARCEDPSFAKVRSVLTSWFGEAGPGPG